MLNIAHRGASGLKPENTKLAFLEALKYNIDAVECDVHLTKDNKIVVIHDYNINRTSNGKGEVNDLTLAELKKFNFNYKFKNLNEKILTLEELFKIFKNKNIKLFIEIKLRDFDINLFLKIIKKHKIEGIVPSSFHYSILEKIREKNKKIKLNYIIIKPNKDSILKANRINCKRISPLFIFLSKKFIEECHKNKIKVFPWVLNKEFLIRKFIKLGADGIISNYPNKVEKIFRE